MVDTSLQDAGMSRVSPEMAFSHRVDIFWKKSYRKIISFKKVTAILQKLKIPEKKVFFQGFRRRETSFFKWTKSGFETNYELSGRPLKS